MHLIVLKLTHIITDKGKKKRTNDNFLLNLYFCTHKHLSKYILMHSITITNIK